MQLIGSFIYYVFPEIPQIDAVAADILNSNKDLAASLDATATVFKSGRKLTNPGLEALWDDERFRREEMGIEDLDLSPPPSPPRLHSSSGDHFETEVLKIKHMGSSIN